MRSMAFRGPFFFWLFVVALLCAAVSYNTFQITAFDKEELHNMVASQPRKLRKTRLRSAQELTRQERWGVTKKIWISDGSDGRRLMQLSGSRSEITVAAKNKDLHFIETFYDVQGMMQQELFYVVKDGQKVPMQRFRYFETDRAVYDFQTRSVACDAVRFWTFEAAGHEVIEKPLALPPQAVGHASSMTLYAGHEETQFCAQDLELQIKTEEGLW